MSFGPPPARMRQPYFPPPPITESAENSPPLSHMAQQEEIEVLTQDYLREIKVRIKKRWLPPRGTEQIRVIAQFRLHRPGDVSRLAIHLSCGNLFVDQTCLRAVESAVYLPKIPDALPDFLDLQFVFEYGFGDEISDTTPQKNRQVMPPRRGKMEHVPSLKLPGSLPPGG